MNAQSLQIAFRKSKFVNYFFFYPEINSTNAKAKELAQAGAQDGGLVVALAQTAGRGREDRTWFSPPQLGLYVSFILRPGTPAASAFGLQMAVALGALDALEGMGYRGLGIKWPNDLMVQGRKLGGMLSEMGAASGAVDWCVVGLGLNLRHRLEDFPSDLQDRAVSLAMIQETPVEPESVLCSVADHAGEWYKTFRQEGMPALAPAWRNRSTLLGSLVRVKTAGETYVGTVAGIEDTGALNLRLESGSHEIIHAGDVHRIQVAQERQG